MIKLQLCYPLNLPFEISQKFGGAEDFYKKYGLKGHNGWDFGVGNGTPVYATHDGEVTYNGLDGANGVIVVLKTNEQYDYKDSQSFYKTHYGHLKTGSVIVNVGQKVKRGEKLAESNNTGASTGPHVHFGIKPITQGEADWQWFNYEQDNGYNGAIDPQPFFDGSYPTPINTIVDNSKFENLMKAVKEYQISKGFMDFANETDPKKIKIGTKTLAAIAKDQK